jgi:hypothetical protein
LLLINHSPSHINHTLSGGDSRWGFVDRHKFEFPATEIGGFCDSCRLANGAQLIENEACGQYLPSSSPKVAFWQTHQRTESTSQISLLDVQRAWHFRVWLMKGRKNDEGTKMVEQFRLWLDHRSRICELVDLLLAGHPS